jgi:hypothetical protein
MPDKTSWVKIPYSVYYHVPRGRKLRWAQVWEDIPLTIRAPTDAEAPVAYRIVRTNPQDDTQTDYDIRHFDGQLWWPVLDNKNVRRAADGFLNGLVEGDCYPLGILRVSGVPLRSSSKPTFDERFREMRVREIVRTSRETQLAFAQRGASETMMCDDTVYVAAQEPFYFGIPGEWARRELSLVVGATPSTPSLGYANRIPGPDIDRRRSALFATRVFGVHDLDKDMALLRQEGFSVRLGSKIEILRDLTVPESALQMCANATLSRLFRDKSVAAAFQERLLGDAWKSAATSSIPLEICREVLRDIVELFAPDNEDCFSPDDLLCARSVLRRLGPALTDEDNEALSALHVL